MIEINVEAKKATLWCPKMTTVAEFREAVQAGRLIAYMKKGYGGLDDKYIQDYYPANTLPFSDEKIMDRLNDYDICCHSFWKVMVYQGFIIKGWEGVVHAGIRSKPSRALLDEWVNTKGDNIVEKITAVKWDIIKYSGPNNIVFG